MDIHDRIYNMILQIKEYPQVVARDKEQLHIIRTLLREGKNNAIVIGNPGIGKKALVQSLAIFIQKKYIPFLKYMILLDTQELIFEYVTKKDVFLMQVHNQIEIAKDTLFFLPDINALFQDNPEEVKKLYPLFSIFAKRSDLRLVCTIDPASYRLYIEKDIFLQKIFEPIRIEEATEEMTEEILLQKAKILKISLTKELAKTIVTFSKRYIYSQFLPEKAIDIFDEAYAKAQLDKQAAVTLDHIREVISDKSGIPIKSISATDQEKLINLDQSLEKRVVGQKNAVHAVSEVIRRSRVGLKDPKKPIGSFLFIGGSGVGKTELAKSLAEFIYDTDNSLIRLDMSEYTESHSLQRLIGAPPGYIGYEEGGQLTNPIWERPYSLLLLDEIEKAHPKIFDIFLQVLDEGRLTDGQGKTVNFNNSIIIATSNAGYAKLVEHILNGEDLWSKKFTETTLIPILMEYFRIEFLNRFDEIIIFKPLDMNDLIKVTKIHIRQLQNRLEEKHIHLEVSDELIQKIAQSGKNPLFGARAIKRVIQKKVENTLAKKILKGEIAEGAVISW